MTVTGVVLAAGASRRMGCPKALLPFGDGTFVQAVVTALRQGGVDAVVVVTRAELFDAVGAAVREAARVVVNPSPEDGMQSSLRVALTDVTAAVCLALVDQPDLRADTVRLLLAAHAAASDRIVIPVTRDVRRGHPVVFPADLVPALRAPHGEGVRQVVWDNAARVLHCPVDDPAPFRNVNTPAELARLLGETSPE